MSHDSASNTEHDDGEYMVVARRYRPQTFDELIGQEHVARALKQAISAQRVGHAYLFTGARGVGKTSAARILAKALNCVRGPSAVPCNECEVCRSITSGDDVDVLEIDGASNRGIDEIRQLRQNVAIRPSRVRFKIYIIDEVHMLTKEAFNALLKTLEEPPEHVKFIFATTEPNKIPITILSRCQRFDFAGVDASAIGTRLAQIAEAEGVQIEPAAVQILAARAAGSMRDSQSLLEQLLATAEGVITAQDVNQLLGIAPAERLSRLAANLVDRNAAGALGELQGMLLAGADEGQLVDQLLGYLRDVMATVVGCGPEQLLFVLPTQVDEVRQIGQRLGIQTVLAIIQILDHTAARMRVSVQGRILAEMAIVRICALHDLDDLATLVSELRSSEGVSPSPSPRTSPALPALKKNGEISSLAESFKAATAAQAAETVVASPSPSTPPSIAIVPASLSPENCTQIWEAALGRVGGLLAANAAMAIEVSAIDGRLQVAFRSRDALCKELCEKPDHLTTLVEALRHCHGGPVRIEFALRDDDADSAKPPMAAKHVSRRQMQAELSERPFVRRAMELFDVEPGKLRFVPAQQQS
ncbi:MAG: DNA polymerase III subunit gamma/tau [Pirellulales bacterium]